MISAVGSFIWKVLSYVYECMTVVLTALQKHTLADSTLQNIVTILNMSKLVTRCDGKKGRLQSPVLKIHTLRALVTDPIHMLFARFTKASGLQGGRMYHDVLNQ